MAFDNMAQMMKIMGIWNKFKQNHPKFPAFLSAVGRKGLHEDMILELTVTEPDGEKFQTNLKITASDLELLNELKALKPNK